MKCFITQHYFFITFCNTARSAPFIFWPDLRRFGDPAFCDLYFFVSHMCPYHPKNLFSHLILHFMQWTSAKRNFDLDKNRFFYECLKTWKSYFLAVDPCRWSQHRHAQSCDVDSGTCDFRLDLSRLFYPCKFSFVVHAKCSFPACCMNY